MTKLDLFGKCHIGTIIIPQVKRYKTEKINREAVSVILVDVLFEHMCAVVSTVLMTHYDAASSPPQSSVLLCFSFTEV